MNCKGDVLFQQGDWTEGITVQLRTYRLETGPSDYVHSDYVLGWYVAPGEGDLGENGCAVLNDEVSGHDWEEALAQRLAIKKYNELASQYNLQPEE